jgi:Ca2+-binding RTX toxin-like protein
VNAGRAGWYQGTFYGNAGNYTDARGVANPNLRGNASEVIGGTEAGESINGMGGNDTIWGDGGNDTVEGGEGNDFLHGGAGNDTVQDSMGDDLLWGDDGDDLVNGGIGIDQLFGGAGSDRMYGGDGADIIDGGSGNDVIYGDNGAVVDGTMDPNGDSDLIAGGSGNDTIYGGGGADALDGGVGDDVLVGGSGADALIGLDGNDLMIMDAGDTGFNQTVDGGLGFDTVDYSASQGRGAALNGRLMGVDINLSNLGPAVAPVGVNAPDAFLSVERAIGSAFDDYIIGGNAVVTDALGNPVLRRDVNGNPIPVLDPVTGQPQVDPLTGLVVFQTIPMEWDLAGGAGNDVLGGGLANDRLDGGAGQDIASYANATAGVRISLGTTGAQNTLGAGTDTLISIEGVVGSAFSDTLIGTGSANVIDGGAGLVSDTLQAGGGNDIVSFLSSGGGVTVTLGLTVAQDTIGAGIDLITGFENIIGSSFDDTLNGDGNNNTLEGGLGNDIINGNGGTDTALYGNSFAAVTVNLGTTAAQNTGGAGIDTLTSIENLVGSGYGDTLTGNANANNISAGFGADVVNGGGGNDTLNGGLGNDIIDGGAGTDIAVFSGNRSAYSFTSSRSGTFTYLFVTGPDGTDRLVNVEQLQFADGIVASPVILTTGADLYTGTTNGDTILALAGADTVNGGAGNDVIEAGDDNDTVNGDAGDDTVTGGRGNDAINGGLGTDTAVYTGHRAWYLVSTDANTGVTTVTDTRVGGDGTDSLTAVERLRFADTTLSLPVILTAAADTYTGTATDDVVYALAGNDTINGGAGNDSLYGAAGNDSLDGGAGADVLVGGIGDDTLVIDNVADVVVENAGEGTDTVRSSVTVAALADNVENLVLTGSAALDGAGNALNNVLTGNTGNNVLTGGQGNDTINGGTGNDTAVFSGNRAGYNIVVNVAAANITVTGADGVDTLTSIENFLFDDGLISAPILLSVNGDTWNGTALDDEVYGLGGSDTLNGNDGADRLTGNAGNDSLNGGAGDDVLWGGAGDDILNGGAGNDTAVYSDATSAVSVSLATTNRQQTGGAGRDTLSSIENLVGSSFNDTLTGDGNANTLQGGAGNDSLNGGAGNDVLAGGLGNDTLVGGTGLDVFLFDTAPNGTTNRDTVNGFVVVDDTIQLSQAVFSALDLGVLDPAAFRAGTAAVDADDRIIFNAANGALFYDADGVGGAAAVQFATLSNITGVVSAADFVVVG